jgi:hypothetical protein
MRKFRTLTAEATINQFVPPSEEISTRYELIDAPPSLIGADHDNAIWPSPERGTSDVGALGVVAGVAVTGEPGAPVPAAFTATTRKAYTVPLVRPDRTTPVTNVVVAVAQVRPPSVERSTMYDVTGAPPSDVGTAHTSAAVPSEAITLRLTGAVGGVRGAIAPETEPDEPVPAALRAEIRKR